MSAQYGTNVFFEDEMREGTRSQCKELWTPKGHRPHCSLKLGYEFTYLYCALNPYEGRMFCLLLPDMTKESFTVFNQKFCQWLSKEHNTGQRVLLIADGAGAHQSSICEGCGIDLVKLPPASPELNPVERFFAELRRRMANRIFENIEEVENHLSQVLQHYYQSPPSISSLTLYPYIRLPN